jgi:hypothetical protein
VPLCRTLACEMQSSDSPSDLTPSNMISHIFGTLYDGQMDMVLTDMVMMAHRWAEIQHIGQCTPGIITHWIDNVATVDNMILCKD